jgi:hypothetical protein
MIFSPLSRFSEAGCSQRKAAIAFVPLLTDIDQKIADPPPHPHRTGVSMLLFVG